MSYFDPQNPGIGGLDELTPAEELFLTSLAGLNYSDGDILYYNTGQLRRLGIGSPGDALIVSGGLPAWGAGGGSGVSTIGTIDSQTPAANGAVISGTSLYMQSASQTVPGLVNNSDQSFSGKKIFANTLVDSTNSDINVSSFLTITNTGNSANGITPTSGRFLVQVTDNFLHTGDFFIGSFSGSSYTGTNTLDVTVGGYSETQNESSGTISSAAGLAGRVGNTSSGTITNAIGLLLDIENTAGGSITTGYGVKINSLGATTNYGFYNDIAGSMDRFVRVGIGVDPTAALHVTETSGSGTQLPLILAVGASHTALTASTEHTEINFNLSSTKQFATGALTTQRSMSIQAPTYGFVGASTIQSAATLAISGAPIKGTNATLNNTIGLWIQSGAVVGAGEASGMFVEAPTGGTLNYAAVIGSAGTASMRFNSTASVALQFQNGNGTEIQFTGAGNGTIIQNNSGSELDFATNTGGMFWSTNLFTNIAFNIQSNKMFIGGNTAATAKLHIAAGSATAATAPLKFTSGVLMTTAEAGAVEFLTDAFYGTVTTNAVRKMFVASTNGRATAQTAANASVATYTLGAADQTFEVSANVLVTTSSAENFTVTVAYTDEGNTARTLTLPFTTLAGASVAVINFANGAVPYGGTPVHIRCKASTTITIATTGTFTGATYNCEGIIKRTN